MSDNWISVNDRMPNDGDEVLVFYSIGIHSILMYNDPRNLTQDIHKYWFNNTTGAWIAHSQVTHWQPLPEPPSKKH